MSAPCDVAPIINFLLYQRKWLSDQSRFKIGMFARQTGKTFTTCAEIVDDCIQAEIRGERTRWVILSRGERQAAEAMDEGVKPFCKAFYHVYAAVLSGKKPPEFSEEEWRVEREDAVVLGPPSNWGAISYYVSAVGFVSAAGVVTVLLQAVDYASVSVSVPACTINVVTINNH